MKDNRFIELVNLYIDRQISAAETADLEAEMQANPQRRAIYRQYCQLHRATTLVYGSFRADAPEKAGAAKSMAKVDRFELRQRRQGIRWPYYVGGLAAACIALVFVRLNNSTPVAPIASMKSTPVAVVAALTPVAAAKPNATAENRATLAGAPTVNLAAEQDYSAMLAAMRREDQQAFASGRLQSARLPSLFDDGVFESQQGFPASSSRVFRSRQSPAQQTEFTAFQFQR